LSVGPTAKTGLTLQPR